MKKTSLLFVLGATLLSACTKDLTKLNVDPKNPTVVPSYSLFTYAEKATVNIVLTPDINYNTFRLIEQQWTETQYVTETQYDLTDRTIPDNIWSSIYAGSLINFEKAKQYAATDVTDAGIRQNDLAIIDILEVYNFYYLVTSFGNIPYSQAFNTSLPFPKFDDAATVYGELLTRLNTDEANLKTTSASWGSADQIYNGDPAQWRKFANALKIRMGVTISDVPGSNAQAIIDTAYNDGAFASNADNALMTYYASPPNTNPTWVELIQSGRHDYVATDSFMAYLGVPSKGSATYTDPRTPYFFAEATAGSATGKYKGSVVAAVVTASDYSLPSGPLYTPGSIGELSNPDYPGDVLDYSEQEFNLAEAAAKGITGIGDAATHYANAVKASIVYWTEGTNDGTAYLAANPINVATEASMLTSIAQQEYIALYNKGWDAWNMTRRLDYPTFGPIPGAYSAFPVRLTYPVVEQNANPVNETAAAKAIGGDKVTTKLWFDTQGIY
jgi:hypothetical protein